MNLFRVYSDDTGETHLARIDLPPGPDGRPPRRVGVSDVPTTTLTLSRLLEPKPDGGLHTPPRRQLVVVLDGALEVTTTAGDRQRFGTGDVLLADDLDSLGHVTRDVGQQALCVLTIGIPDDWEWPTP